jgi:hypothetical protein
MRRPATPISMQLLPPLVDTPAMPDLRTALWLGALMLAAGCTVTPWPDEVDELAAEHCAVCQPAVRA